MAIELKDIKNIRIVPENYEGATVCDIKEKTDDIIKFILPYVKEDELKEYKKGKTAEFFGLHKNGLVYFTSEIENIEDNFVYIKNPGFIKEIQRRKYSRVPYVGKLHIDGIEDDKITPEDISAGGVRFYSSVPLKFGFEYEAKIELETNLIVNCSMQPIRIEEVNDDTKTFYSISMKFSKIRSIDRIALMQYSLRHISELQNKT